MKSPCLYYFNPLFDLSLGGYKTEGHVKSAAEMGCLFMPAAASDDMILLDVSVPDEYSEYYRSCGLDCPQILPAGEQCSGLDGVAWGWNNQAVERLTGAGARCINPGIAVVKKVNARSFGLSVNKKTGAGVSDAAYFLSKDELQKGLMSWKRFPLVIKPDHGNAGYGFIRKMDPRLTDKESKNLDTLFANGSGVTVEPWLNRTVDISSICTISAKGGITGIRPYRSVQSSTGSFVADIMDPNDTTIAQWRDQLEEAVSTCAPELYSAGYFGPAGFDSFTYNDDAGNEKLARIIEINARHSMGNIALALYDKLAQNRVAMFRMLNRKRYRLPDTYDAFFKLLGDDAFDKDNKRGAFLITPLRIAHGDGCWIQPSRSAIFLTEKSLGQLYELDIRVRDTLTGNFREKSGM